MITTVYALLDMSDKKNNLINVFADKEEAETQRAEIANTHGIPENLLVIKPFQVKDNS